MIEGDRAVYGLESGIVEVFGAPQVEIVAPDMGRILAPRVWYEMESGRLRMRNPKDDHSQGVFGELRGKTDRFVLKLRKP